MNPRGDKKLSAVFYCFTVLLCLFLAFSSCKSYHTEKAKKRVSADPFSESFAEKIKTLLKPVDTLNAAKQIRNIGFNVRYTYQLNEYIPVWFYHNKPNKAADSFLNDLENIRWDGLDPEHYKLSELRKLYHSLFTDSTNLDIFIAYDTTFTSSYLAAARDILLGEINPRKADSLWFHKNDTVWNAPLLVMNNDEEYVPLNHFRSQLPTYGLLRNAYKHYCELAADKQFVLLHDAINKIKNIKYAGNQDLNIVRSVISYELPWLAADTANISRNSDQQLISVYQYYMGLRPSGKLDSLTLDCLSSSPQDIAKKIKANMERIRWMQISFNDLYLLVNVPLMELFLRKDGTDIMHMRVVVGKPERQTPSLGANMANIIINPPWGVPPTILKKDVLPGITKSGEKYLSKKGLKAYTRDGKHIDEGSITPQNYNKYTYKQSPGDDNSLGYVKFNLPNPWDIYLHDTPHRDDFGKRYRALSSGCIRVQQPKEMAVYILSQLEKRRFTDSTLDSMIKTHKTRWEALKNKIPVHIAYLTAFEDSLGTHPRLLSDIYKRDSSLISLLK